MADTAVSKMEGIKAASNQLRGTIGEELSDGTPAFSPESQQLLRFHGIYQQDDRDVRTERKRQRLDVDHICMVRVSIPGGILTAEQYLAMDTLCDAVASGTLRITSRQGIQYHFVRKGDLHSLLATLNHHLVTTLGACGDVVRNIMCCPAPLSDRQRADVGAYAQETARRFRPRTHAYYHLWLDGERAVTAVEPGEAPGEEPLYGTTYLPRKFKIGFAFPGDNCIDVYSNDIGVVPVLDGESLRGFTVLVGGGMGKNHTNPDTFPRLADPLTTVAPEELLEVLATIVRVQRDHGDRHEREHARLKYLIHEWGIDRFGAEVAQRLGRSLPAPEPVVFEAADDHLGWHPQDGPWFLGVKVENGRIADRGAVRVRSGLRAVVERFSPGVRLTPREDILLTDLADRDRPTVEALLRDHGVVPAEQWVPIKRNSFACPALPTCGLALTESERALPGVLDELEAELDALGLGGLDAHVRMTGCPNGCSRPYTAEIGLVGRGKKNYDIHLGGETVGIRLNDVFAENVPRDKLVNVLRPVLAYYRDPRRGGERFGDFCHRLGVDRLRAELGTERWARKPRDTAKENATPS
ncbi:MAG: NADPH-dependent assimilatory sulfite reductase hemoprotein subunit [Actinomycetota bacterium]|nr:NADPH-dependent assimilatory sulfite reductase hemoprotein subunit [Actinomycetota bacterium]